MIATPAPRHPRHAHLRVSRLPVSRLLPLLVLPVIGLLASCSGGSGSAQAADAPVSIPVSPLPASLPATTVETTTTVPPTLETTSTTTLETTTTATTAPATATTAPSNLEIVGPAAQPIPAVGRSSGEATKLVQERLRQLGFWNSGSDGSYGLTTEQAVMAFQKYLGLPTTSKVDETTAAYLTNFTEKAHGLTDTGDLVEVDKTRQLLFIVRDGKTMWTLNTSTGNGLPYEEEDKNSPGEMQTGVSLTPNGLWKVDRERPEGWWEGDLGEIYRPKYFRGGVAVHGSNSIPDYPASHGCVRVSVPAMDFIWEWDLMPMTSTVWVHGG